MRLEYNKYLDSGIAKAKFLVPCLYTVVKLNHNPSSPKGQYEIDEFQWNEKEGIYAYRARLKIHILEC